jgi:CBS domain-containing protein
MKVREAMSRDVYICAPGDTIRDVAMKMRDGDFGSVPVGSRDRLEGTITDRDIAIRAVAAGCGPDTPVRDVMSKNVLTCREDDDIDDAADMMRERQIRRLPVTDRDGRICGMLAFADLAMEGSSKQMGKTLRDVSEPQKAHH